MGAARREEEKKREEEAEETNPQAGYGTTSAEQANGFGVYETEAARETGELTEGTYMASGGDVDVDGEESIEEESDEEKTRGEGIGGSTSTTSRIENEQS